MRTTVQIYNAGDWTASSDEGASYDLGHNWRATVARMWSAFSTFFSHKRHRRCALAAQFTLNYM
jgi:hypothetical protein